MISNNPVALFIDVQKFQLRRLQPTKEFFRHRLSGFFTQTHRSSLKSGDCSNYLQDHIVNIDQFDTTLFCVKKILQKSKLIISMLLISSTVFRVKFISSLARNELFLFFGQLTSFGISIASRSWMIKVCRLITRWYVNAIDFFVLCKILRNIAHVYPLSELLV